MNEIWRHVVGYEGLYEVSSIGRVRGLDRTIKTRWGTSAIHRGRILKPSTSNNGYITVELWKDSKNKRTTVHRLVAQSFVGNPESKPEVNHIDGVKSHNDYRNLEWVTRSENERHAFMVLGKKNAVPNKPVIAFNGEEELYFSSACDAARNGFYQGAIVGVLKGRCKTHAGYSWRYA